MDNARCGDTFFNEWPVPMYQPSQMPKVNTDEHEKIFMHDTAVDEGAEDGTGAAMLQDLGDGLIPFPREIHVKFMREMIHVFGIEAAVLFWVGSGQTLLAFVLERKRAVAVVRNAAEKKFVKATLARAVKSLGLAPDRRPTKPAELVAWEARGAVGGAPPNPKAGVPPPRPPVPAAGALAPAVRSGVTAAGGTPNVFTVRPPAVEPPPAAASSSAAPAAAPPVSACLAAFGASTLR